MLHNQIIMRMKTKCFFFFILLLIYAPSCNSNQRVLNADKSAVPADGESAEISFSEYEYNFGKITEGEKVAHIFTFENKGPGSLVISSASTSCGCTVTKYDRKPIPSGKGGSLEVVFDSNGRNGIQTKTISVNSNSKTQIVLLKITADVISQQDK
jgi:hypothetical protein